MWGLDPFLSFLITWGVGALLIMGVWWEIERPTDGDTQGEIFGYSLLWPVVLSVLVTWGTIWLLTWIPRGPTRLVLWLLYREKHVDLPEARMVER